MSQSKPMVLNQWYYIGFNENQSFYETKSQYFIKPILPKKM